jgi:hypothetical protein
MTSPSGLSPKQHYHSGEAYPPAKATHRRSGALDQAGFKEITDKLDKEGLGKEAEAVKEMLERLGVLEGHEEGTLSHKEGTRPRLASVSLSDETSHIVKASKAGEFLTGKEKTPKEPDDKA